MSNRNIRKSLQSFYVGNPRIIGIPLNHFLE